MVYNVIFCIRVDSNMNEDTVGIGEFLIVLGANKGVFSIKYFELGWIQI